MTSTTEDYESDCKVCNQRTMHTFHSTGHERDSSNNWSRCHRCGLRCDGWGEASDREISEAKERLEELNDSRS